MRVCVCVCLSDRRRSQSQNQSIDLVQIRYLGSSCKYLEPFPQFAPTPKIKGSSHEKKIKIFFLDSGNFPGKAGSVILSSFECTINPQNLIKLLKPFFIKSNFHFSSYVNYPSIQWQGRTKKTARDICKRTLGIEFKRDRSIGLGATFGDSHTDTSAHARTHAETYIYLKRTFRLWENHQLSKQNFWTIAKLPLFLMSLESKNEIVLEVDSDRSSPLCT